MQVIPDITSFILLIVLHKSHGFTCFKCSYSANTEGNRRECIENPEALGTNSRLSCNSTSFCVLQEHYNIREETVTSYFRSCSGNSWSNECNKDWDYVTCTASCRGDYCNELDRGNRSREYLAKYRESSGFNSALQEEFSLLTFAFSLLFLAVNNIETVL